MSLTNFFIVPAGNTASQFQARSGNIYVPQNNLVTNVAVGDITDMINAGLRQVAGPDAGANLPWVASRFYVGIPGATPGTLALTASTIYAYPFRVPANIPVQTLNVDVTTAGQSGTTARFGLYSDNAGAPGTQVAGSESGSQIMTSTGAVTYTPAAPLTLNEGWYWAAFSPSSATTMPTVAAIAASYASNLTAMLGQDTLAHAIAASGEEAMGVTATFVYGSLPQSFPTASYALSLAAAVPLVVIGT